MPRQEVMRWSPLTCGCQIYINTVTGKVIDYKEVKRVQEERISANDPTVNPVISPPPVLCDKHKLAGHQIDDNLVKVIREEQAKAAAGSRESGG